MSVETATDAPADLSPLRRDILVPAIVGVGLLVQTLSTTVIVNALPTMGRALGETPVNMNIAITCFLLSGALFLPVSGWIADRYGARSVFVAAILVFALGSLWCGFSKDLPELIAGRCVQGAASALMTPVGRLIILRTSAKADLVQALAVLGMPSMLGPVVGPALGGFIVTYGDWRWIFFMNVPICALGVILVLLYVPNVREDERPPLDWTGLFLTAIASAGLVFGFENIGKGALPFQTVAGMIVVGALSGFLFFRHARRSPAPILDPSLLRHQTLRASIVGGAFIRLAIGAFPFLLALFLQLGFGMSAFAAGLTTFASAVGALGMRSIAPPILRRFGFKRVLIVNNWFSALGLAVYALLSPATPHLLLLAVLFVSGFFRMLQFTSLNAIAYSDVTPLEMSRASALSAMGQQLAQSLGVGVAAMLLNLSLRTHSTHTLSTEVIAPVFVAIGVLTLLGHFWFARLPEDAGLELTGRQDRASASA